VIDNVVTSLVGLSLVSDVRECGALEAYSYYCTLTANPVQGIQLYDFQPP